MADLVNKNSIDCVFFNNDYTPYSKKRDSSISSLLKSRNIKCFRSDDLLLYPLNSVLTQKGTPYTKFGFYHREALKKRVFPPKTFRLDLNKCRIAKSSWKVQEKSLETFFEYNAKIAFRGGRKNAEKILRSIKNQKNYNNERDLVVKKTSGLSAYLRFGVVSIRECYKVFRETLGTKTKLLDQLYWNCFYTELGNNFPDMYSKTYMIPRFKNIKWVKNEEHLEAWKCGKTGFPLTDAGMREMNSTGFMHNRARMVSATLLSRILLINWREGEKYFSTKLIDHLRSNNDGNWFWVVGTANHSQVYFRIMNEWNQIKKYDFKCEYIKKWIPELREVPVEHIHNWSKKYELYKNIKYPKPIVDYEKQRIISLQNYKKATL